MEFTGLEREKRSFSLWRFNLMLLKVEIYVKLVKGWVENRQ
jgi:hypothetical protein